jgi:ABC-type Mn2+/Zn2+ transport system permease subunit
VKSYRCPVVRQNLGETEHLKDMLVGNILAVSWPEVAHTAMLYGTIGLFHLIFRKNFLQIFESSALLAAFWL